MKKIKCPKCSSIKVKIINSKDTNHKFENEWDVKIGTRATAVKKKVLTSYDKVMECKCEKCGNFFTSVENVKVKNKNNETV